MNEADESDILERPFFTIAGVKINRSSFLFRLIYRRQLFGLWYMPDRTAELTAL